MIALILFFCAVLYLYTFINAIRFKTKRFALRFILLTLLSVVLAAALAILAYNPSFYEKTYYRVREVITGEAAPTATPTVKPTVRPTAKPTPKPTAKPETLTSAQFRNADNVRAFHDGLARVTLSDGTNGYIDVHGNTVVYPKWDSASDFSNGIATVEKNELEGAIDTNGNIVVPVQYKHLYWHWRSLLFSATDTAGKESVLDKTGKVICSGYDDCTVYDGEQKNSDVYIRVKKGSQYSLPDSKGMTLIPFSDTVINYVFADRVVCVKNGKYGLADTKGSELLACTNKAIFPSLVPTGWSWSSQALTICIFMT